MWSGSSFSQKMNCQYNCQRINDGSIELIVTPTKKPTKYNLQKAQKDAIMAVLYSTISSTNCQTQPPLLGNGDEKRAFNKYKRKFLSKRGEWKLYVSNNEAGNSIQNTQTNSFKVTVMKAALRKHLEQKEIIKPLNTGF
jgi:hypothetical protein